MSECKSCESVTDASFKAEVLDHREPVLVEFGADWCGPCHIVAPILEELTLEFKGKIKICQVDVDANEKVVNQYGVQGLPTFLFFKAGQVVDHMVGAVSKQMLKAKLNALLQTKLGKTGGV